MLTAGESCASSSNTMLLILISKRPLHWTFVATVSSSLFLSLQIVLLKDLLDPPAMLVAGVYQPPFLGLIFEEQTAQFVQPMSS